MRKLSEQLPSNKSNVYAADIKQFHAANKLPIQEALTNMSDLQILRSMSLYMSNTTLLRKTGGKIPKHYLKDSLQTETDVCKVPLLPTDLLPSTILRAFHTVLTRQ